MNRGSIKSRTIVGVLFFALLIGVQTISVAHAYEHDPASLGDTACATCISINQLAAASVDTGQAAAPTTPPPIHCAHPAIIAAATLVGEHRQRGPPRSS